MGEVTPLFIFGMGRSGTTSALRVLIAHPAVMLNGEFPLAVMKRFFDLLDGVENSYGGNDATGEAWRSRKSEFMFDSFGYLSKGGRGQLRKIPGARFRGHKTPRHETLFDRYESHFGSVGLRPRYFYCARNPFDCWRSYRAVAWNNHETVGSFLAQYMESFAWLERMQDRAAGRVAVLDLDSLIASADPVSWYRTAVFEPLGLDVPEKVAQRIGKIGGERDATPSRELDGAERRTIRDHPGMAALIARLSAGRYISA